MNTEPITLKELATELDMDRSNLRKYTLKLGITPYSIRTPESRNQATLAVGGEDADTIRQARADAGFLADPVELLKPFVAGDGLFYIVHPDPEMRPERVKLGYTTNLKDRMATYKTSNPDMAIAGTAFCKQHWEAAWIALLTGASECTHIAGEVFDCANIDALVRRLDNSNGCPWDTSCCHGERAGLP